MGKPETIPGVGSSEIVVPRCESCKWFQTLPDWKFLWIFNVVEDVGNCCLNPEMIVKEKSDFCSHFEARHNDEVSHTRRKET